MSGREINLDGGEISVIKALGVGSGEMNGEDLMTRLGGELVPAELIETLKGLIMMGYVEADKNAFYNSGDLGSVHFRVNSGYSKDLREALSPQHSAPKKSKRVRRE
jgi:hypothetical protein